MPFNSAIHDREHDKFVECPTGETAVRVCVANESGDPIPVTGNFAGSAIPAGPFKITVGTATDVSTNPIASPLSDRASLSIRNKSATVTLYVYPNATGTPDDTATGAWEVNPQEDLNLDLDDSNVFFIVTPAGQTAVYKILEIASTSAGGGGSTGTPIQEQLTGAVNGVNTVFTTSQTPVNVGSFQLFVDGVYQRTPAHYSRVGTTVTLVTPPTAGQEVDAVYVF